MKRSSEKVFGDILYAQCWEDPDLDRAAFHIAPCDTVFSITSGGCNTLAFLVDNPRKIYALDLNPHQNYLLDLKMGAFAALSYEEMIGFLGVVETAHRGALYSKVRPHLRIDSRRYWDPQKSKIERGVIHAGRYEGYMALLRTWLQRLKGRAVINDLFAAEDPEERAEIYRTRWDSAAWRLFTRVLLSRRMMGFLFTDDFFTYVEGSFSFGKHFSTMVERALTGPTLTQNYFASYILLGRYYDKNGLPPYLRPENYEAIRSRLDRVEIITAGCEDFFARCEESSIQKFNFTNIFEWMSPGAYERLLRETWRVASHGAVLTYRNLLVFRERPASLEALIVPERPLAHQLHQRDRSFIYRNYVVEIIRKEASQWHTTFALSGTGTR